MTQEAFDGAEHGMGGMKRSALEPHSAAEITYICLLFFSMLPRTSRYFFAISGSTVPFIRLVPFVRHSLLSIRKSCWLWTLSNSTLTLNVFCYQGETDWQSSVTGKQKTVWQKKSPLFHGTYEGTSLDNYGDGNSPPPRATGRIPPQTPATSWASNSLPRGWKLLICGTEHFADDNLVLWLSLLWGHVRWSLALASADLETDSIVTNREMTMNAM